MGSARFVLPSITSLSKGNSTWRQKVTEIEHLGLHQVALFLTGFRDAADRAAVFQALRQLQRTHAFSVPFVHATSSMTVAEYRLLQNEFGTECFNLHPTREYAPVEHLPSDLRAVIGIENATGLESLRLSDVEGFGGVCLDISHLEDLRQFAPRDFDEMIVLLSQVPILANHISAVDGPEAIAMRGARAASNHYWQDGNSFDYLRHYNETFFGCFCAIEIENPLAEQIIARETIAASICQHGAQRLAA